jgi:TRAP-type transport system periplasmic protein
MFKMRSWENVWICAALLLFAAGSATAAEKKAIDLTLGTTGVMDEPTTQGCQKFADLVKAKSNGAINIKVFPASQLGTTVQMVEAVKMGAQDFVVEQLTWFQEMDGMSALRYFALPAGFRNVDQAKKFMNSARGKELQETLRTKHNIRFLDATWDRPDRQVASKKPIYELKDLKGLKIRVPEQELWVGAWKAQGANPTPIAWPEVYTAVQQGVVDAMECPRSSIYNAKIHEQAKYLILTHHSLALISVAMNEKKFQSLTPDQQKILIAAAKEAGEYGNKLHKADDEGLDERFKKDGATVIEIKDLAAFWKPQEAFNLDQENKGKWPKGLMKEINSIK